MPVEPFTTLTAIAAPLEIATAARATPTTPMFSCTI
jgi:hypothetical protein